jgi:hypothetical protein
LLVGVMTSALGLKPMLLVRQLMSTESFILP